MPKVLNKRTASEADLENAVLIDRTTPWGNPFPVGPGQHTRKESLELFRKHIDKQPKLKAAAKIHLRGRNLVCWCKPRNCHGDIWLEIANE